MQCAVNTSTAGEHDCIFVMTHICTALGFPGGSVVMNPPANAGDVDSIPGLGRAPGGGNATHSSIL